MSAAGFDAGRLEFGVLGPFEVWRSGERLALGGRQQRAVLAMLLCEAGTVVSVGRLADTLWAGAPPPGFLTSLQTYVFHLREVLEPDRARGAPGRVLVTEPGGGYRLQVADSSVDAARFEAMVAQGRTALATQDAAQAVDLFDQALALWRGSVLSDIAEFGFVPAFAGRLEAMRLSGLESRLDAELSLGHHDAALAALGPLVVDHPLRERLHAQRMLAFYRSGQQSGALAAYRDPRTTLHDELGIDPSPPLQELHRAILAQDPALDWHPSAPAVAAAVAKVGGLEPAPGDASPVASPAVVVGPDRPRRWSRRTIVAASALAAALAIGGTTAAIVASSGPSSEKSVSANSIGEVRADGSIAAGVPVGTNPVGLVSGGGSLWVANRSEKSVWRIDPKTHAVVHTFDVGLTPEALAVTADNVWVANFGDGTVSRIKMRANKVVQRISVGTRPAAIASGPSGVWVANSGDNTIQRIDPLTGHPDNAIVVGDGPDGIAVDADSVWVANGRESSLSRIDPLTRDERSSKVRVGSGPKGVALSGDEVWVANQLSQSVTRVSRSTGRAQSFVVGDGPTFVAAVQGSVWVSEQYDGALSRIDRASGRVKRFALGSSPRGLAAVGGHVWVATGAFSAVGHSGGTLTVASHQAPGTNFGIDPANIYDPFTALETRQVYDGLVALRYASESQVLVPDLAVDLPILSNGEKTYVFTLRRGIKYSTGADVRASDFVLGMQRALTHGVRWDFYNGIVGGQHCHDHPDACDLSQGAKANDAAGTVTFVLIAPDPEFLYKLTYFVVPTPPGTPVEVQEKTPVPGTGPYMITDHQPDNVFTLARNPWFHRWSFAAQPDGYPDVIRWLPVKDTRAAADAVTSGHADIAWLTPLGDRRGSGAVIDSLNVRYPAQLHSDLTAEVGFELLNQTVPPFNKLKARQAVNYAVDRTKLVELSGGASTAVVTCQLLPPTFPAHLWRCPYTTGPQDGRYHGPDLAKARALVTASGTRGLPVTVYNVPKSLAPPFSEYVAHVLRQLGYQVRLKTLPNPNAYDDFLLNPRNHVQVIDGGWIPDFPLPSNFYFGVVACGAYAGQYCNRALDRQAAAATANETADPAAALRAWTTIDHALVDDAAIVPGTVAIDWWFTSARVGNFQSGQLLGPQLSQLWVR
ncbi:MAG: ABC transporter substrate-binding protein [Actinomycetota bacterium]|nr:ABC transporter substrate-binding protein [Actinomycetota bacterium]